ncbi:MAG: hypothetical protein NTX29_10980 [Actinobacteria bacterium]|nr:hypothetical protein [Actinomycetota bacterium]
MTWSLLLNEAVLLACIVAGAAVGLWIHRRVASGGSGGEVDHHDMDRLGETIGFIGGAFGILLGLLLIFSVQHYGDARNSARDEAVASSSLFKSASPFTQVERDRLRRDLVCLMRSSATDDWTAGESKDLTGSSITNAWEAQVQADVEKLTYDTDARNGYQYFIVQDSLDVSKARQARLLYTQPDIPLLVRMSVIACSIILLVTIGTLTALDEPFTGAGSSVTPVALNGALTRLHDATPGPIWDPCPTMSVTTANSGG